MAGKSLTKKGAVPSTEEDFLPKKKQAPSLLNVLLLYSTLIGLGAIGGYLVFYNLFHTRCADILDENEVRHNVTRQELEGKYLAAVEEHHNCLEQETTKMEISELRNRLDVQASMTGKQNNMLEQNQESAERLANLHVMHEETLLKFHNLQSEVSQKESELAAVKQDIAVYTREQNMFEKQLIGQDEHNDNILSKKVQEARQFRIERDSCHAARKIMELDAKEIKDQIQHRHGVLSRETFGQGPYYSEFRLQFPHRSEIDSFWVEVPSRNELPHSVFTFMDMVESKLYDDTSILSKGDGAMRIGGSQQQMARLSQRYKTVGYGKSVLSFIENSPSFPCKKNSVGFVGRGSALEIHISDHHVHDQDRTCLGRVVQGMDVLAMVETSIEKGEVVEIVQVRHEEVPDAKEIKKLIQHRHEVLCLETFGQGPYYSEFRLQFPDRSGTDSFWVEVPSRNELPHSVFTFMDLVEFELYDDTPILSRGDGAMCIGGSPQQMARLSQHHKTLGSGKSVLSFTENSPSFPCRKHSVGFVGRGPALEIYISDRHVHDQDRTCLGRVVQGMDVLAMVETSIEKGEVVEIVQVRNVLHVPEAESRREL